MLGRLPNTRGCSSARPTCTSRASCRVSERLAPDAPRGSPGERRRLRIALNTRDRALRSRRSQACGLVQEPPGHECVCVHHAGSGGRREKSAHAIGSGGAQGTSGGTPGSSANGPRPPRPRERRGSGGLGAVGRRMDGQRAAGSPGTAGTAGSIGGAPGSSAGAAGAPAQGPRAPERSAAGGLGGSEDLIFVSAFSSIYDRFPQKRGRILDDTVRPIPLGVRLCSSSGALPGLPLPLHIARNKRSAERLVPAGLHGIRGQYACCLPFALAARSRPTGRQLVHPQRRSDLRAGAC